MSTTEDLTLDRDTIARVDASDLLTDILAIPEHMRDALWKVGVREPVGVGLSGRPGGRGDGRLGDRGAARARGARRPRLAAAAVGAGVRPAALDDPRHDGPVLQLLGQHRGDPRVLRGRGRPGGAARGRDVGRRASRPRPQGRRPGDPGRRRAAAPGRGRLHDGRRARGGRAVRSRPAPDLGDRRGGRPPRAARRRVGARVAGRLGGQVAGAHAAGHGALDTREPASPPRWPTDGRRSSTRTRRSTRSPRSSRSSTTTRSRGGRARPTRPASPRSSSTTRTFTRA